MGKLDGKVALITGIGRGTGKAYALGLAREGARIFGIVNKRVDELEKTLSEIRKMGGEADGMKADVSIVSDINAMVKKAADRFGKIDILINNAGIWQSKPFLETTEADFDKVIAIDLKGVYFCCQAVARDMVAKGVKGSIINISANQAIMGVNVKQSDYTAAKGGVNALTRVLAAELAEHGIRVNTLAIGLTATEGVRDVGAEVVKRLEEMAKTIFPLKRIGRVEDFVGIMVWLASDESSYCTASTINVDGGVHAIQLH